MARRRYRRRRRSGRWAPNIVKISNQLTATVGEWYALEDLAINPIQSNSGVSQTFTVKNFEITFTLEPTGNVSSNDNVEAVTAFIMFAPQGMNVTSSFYAEHPEYILAYKYLGSPGSRSRFLTETGATLLQENQQYQPMRIKSRLSRKLQTGDRILLFIQGSNEGSFNVYVNLSGIVRWWSKAN